MSRTCPGISVVARELPGKKIFCFKIYLFQRGRALKINENMHLYAKNIYKLCLSFPVKNFFAFKI